MPSRFTRPRFQFLKIEIDMLADSSDSEEDTALPIQEKWWQNGPKNNLEISKESKVKFHLQLVLPSSLMSWSWTLLVRI